MFLINLKKKFKNFKASNIETFLILLIAVVIFCFGINKILKIDKSSLDIVKDSTLRLVYWLPIFYLILSLSYFGRYLRWRLILGSFSIGSWSRDDALSWFKGFALTASPGKIGEISRIRTTSKELGYSKKILLIAFFFERFLDASAVLIWILVLLPELILEKLIKLLSNNFDFIMLIIFFIVFIFFYLFKKFKKIFKKNWVLITGYLSRGQIIILFLKSLSTSVCFWGIEAMILWLLVYVLSPDSISQANAIKIYLFSGLAGVLSGLPGGIGVNEATATLLLQKEGVPTLIALSISILRRLITIWSITLFSIILSITTNKLR